MRPPTIRVTVDRVDQVINQVRQLTNRQVLVGVPSSTAGDRTQQVQTVPGSNRKKKVFIASPKTPNFINNATLAYIHNFGSPAANIPARPFLTEGIESVRPKLIAQLERAARFALEGDQRQVENQLNAVGLTAQYAVQKKITDGPFVPLAQRTLDARKARGVTRTKPLIDTGALRQSIRYVLSSRSP